jgi:predicted DNA-binding transcriptional regulator
MAKTVEEIKKEIRKDIDELEKKFEKYKEGGFQVTEIAKF